ncbi:MAG TPA: hypothetical protein VGR56_01425 [Nitrososphaerales archaeon]|nr:hypothetical protein [Nitrososphaerales archaeon]
MRTGFVKMGIFLFGAGVLVLILGGNVYLSFSPICTGRCSYGYSLWGNILILGGLLVASGLAITSYGVLKKGQAK